jgi:hypothetical protein
MAEPTLAEIIRLAIASKLLDVHSAEVARVESYNAATQTIDALPMVRRAIVDSDGDVQHEELPKIPNVPVLFPRSGAFSLTWPLAPGDFVLLVFCSSACGNWRETGDVSDPGDLRRHDLSYSFAVPGIGPNSATLPTMATAALFEVSSPATHVQVGAGSAQFVALSNLVESLVGALAAAILNATPTGGDGGAAVLAAAKATLSGQGWTGGGTTPPAGATAATKLKSE